MYADCMVGHRRPKRQQPTANHKQSKIFVANKRNKCHYKNNFYSLVHDNSGAVDMSDMIRNKTVSLPFCAPMANFPNASICVSVSVYFEHKIIALIQCRRCKCWWDWGLQKEDEEQEEEGRLMAAEQKQIKMEMGPFTINWYSLVRTNRPICMAARMQSTNYITWQSPSPFS